MTWMEQEYNAKQNKSEKDKYQMISLMWNLRNKTEEGRGREGKIKQDEIREGDKPRRLLTIGNKLRVAGGEGGDGH